MASNTTHTSPAMNAQKVKLPSHCFDCEKPTEWKLIEGVDTLEIKGEPVEHACTYFSCEHCGYEMMTPAQLKADLLAATEAYQEKHKLLTAEQVVTRRKALGLTQEAFCDLAKGVKPASLKRLELGQRVQDESTDVAIATALNSLEKAKEQREMIQFALHTCTPSNKVSGVWSEGFSSVAKTVGIAASVCFSIAPAVTKPQRERLPQPDSFADMTSDSSDYALGA